MLGMHSQPPASSSSVDTWPSLSRVIVAVAVCQAVGGLGVVFTSRSLKTWYPTLKKPPFNPPNGVFGPVWTLLYTLMGIAFAVAAERSTDADAWRAAQRSFALQLGLNTLWSGLFFGLRSPLAALIEMGFLWVAIVQTIMAFRRISPLAAWLLAPYLAWVSFAALLNAAIWRRNA